MGVGRGTVPSGKICFMAVGADRLSADRRPADGQAADPGAVGCGTDRQEETA
jgi:hypothetical protein